MFRSMILKIYKELYLIWVPSLDSSTLKVRKLFLIFLKMRNMGLKMSWGRRLIRLKTSINTLMFFQRIFKLMRKIIIISLRLLKSFSKFLTNQLLLLMILTAYYLMHHQMLYYFQILQKRFKFVFIKIIIKVFHLKLTINLLLIT